MNLQNLIQDVSRIPLVPLRATSQYQQKTAYMKQFVDAAMTSQPSIHELIGRNPLQMMYDNHQHHAAFMTTVFSTGFYEMLARTVPWVYRTYNNRQFSYDYFSVELNCWLEAMDKFMDAEDSVEIRQIYQWMLDNHDHMIHISRTGEGLPPMPVPVDWLDQKNTFLSAVMDGDHRTCLNLFQETVSTAADLQYFYLNIIQPVLYEIGMLWERGEISVAREHLASAIIGRVMASAAMLDPADHPPAGKAIVTAAPGELHEIGAWMISDILEQEGWDVRYLGANIPVDDLLMLVYSFSPDFVFVSVTMPFHVLGTKEVIKRIKADEKLQGVQVAVGGRVFNENPGLWKSTGADVFAPNLAEIKELLSKWAGQGGGD